MTEFEDGFPTMVYQDGGIHQRPGGMFSFMGADCSKELAELIAHGWVKTMPEVIDGPSKDAIEDDSPPTRDELEGKAKELGIGFNWKTKDESLAAKIQAALRARGNDGQFVGDDPATPENEAYK
ncbi:MAG: hypothetical protein ABUJ92_00500 [Desulfobacterales bacterium]